MTEEQNKLAEDKLATQYAELMLTLPISEDISPDLHRLCRAYLSLLVEREPATEAVLELLKRAADALDRWPEFKPTHCPKCLKKPGKSPMAVGFTINDGQEHGVARCHACGHRWQTIAKDDPLIDELRAALKGKGASQGAKQVITGNGEVCLNPYAEQESRCAPEPSGGFVRVPREPTAEMLSAAAWALGDFYAKEGGWCGHKAGEEQARLTYVAMLAASPNEQKG